MDQDLRKRLIEVAKRRETTSYSDIRPEAPQTLAAPLDEINIYEQRAGRPLLTAVVIHKDGDSMLGVGFFTIAWELGQYLNGDPHQFWNQELEWVWDYWTTNP